MVFDKEGGDFSKPIYKVLSDNGGSLSYATISHKTLNKVGAATPEDPYFYIMETPDNQWDQKWKLNNEFDGAADGHNPGAITKISVIFNVENYTHKVELAN